MERWNEKDYLLTLDLYFKIKDSRTTLGASNPQVQELAEKINRTPASVAMRLQNYAYYDSEGEKGLKNGGKACESYLEKFKKNRNLLNQEIQEIQNLQNIQETAIKPKNKISPEVINSIVVNLVYELKAPELIVGDNNIFTILSLVGEYIDCSVFKYNDLQILSEKIQKFPDIPIDTFFKVLKQILEIDMAKNILNIFGIFDPRFNQKY